METITENPDSPIKYPVIGAQGRNFLNNSLVKPSYMRSAEYLRTITVNNHDRIDFGKGEAVGNFRLIEPQSVRDVKLSCGGNCLSVLDSEFHDMTQPLPLLKSFIPDNGMPLFPWLRYQEVKLDIASDSSSACYMVDVYRVAEDSDVLTASWPALFHHNTTYTIDAGNNSINLGSLNGLTTELNIRFNGVVESVSLQLKGIGSNYRVQEDPDHQDILDRLNLYGKYDDIVFNYDQNRDMWVYKWSLDDSVPYAYQMPNFSNINGKLIVKGVGCDSCAVEQEKLNILLCQEGIFCLRYSV